MSDLKNSQRINYKATYNQISPGIQPRQMNPNSHNRPNPNMPNQPVVLRRALEKTSFVKSLNIRPEELSKLKEAHLNKRISDTDKKAAYALYDVVEMLVTDATASATLNNAANFASIDASKIIEFAHLLIDERDKTNGDVKKSIDHLISSYKSSQHKSASPTVKEVAGVSTSERDPNVKTQLSINSSGTAIKTIVFPSEINKTEKKDKDIRQITSEEAHITIDENNSPVRPVISEYTKPTGQTISANVKDAIAWAEENDAESFSTLYNHISPYLGDARKKEYARSNVLMSFMSENYSTYFNHARDKGAIAGFETRMTIEPVGFLHLERIEMYPSGIERGELVHSVPLAPSETVNISHKEWSVRQQEFEEIVQDYFEGYSEEGVSEKNDLAMSNESQSKHATALNIGASLSASYSSVTLSTSFGYNSTTDDEQSRKDSRNHSMTITKKASARTKKDHKVTFKVSSVIGSEDQSVRMITNPSDQDAMRIDYFQMARKWKADLLRYGLRMTYDIVVPAPGSALMTKVRQVKDLDALINVPFTFDLPLSAIWYNSLASDPHYISNYDQLAAQYNASVIAPPEAILYQNVHKETEEVEHYDHVNFDSLEFEIDSRYYIYAVQARKGYQNNLGDDRSYFRFINLQLGDLINKSGKLALDIEFQYIYNYALNIELTLRPKVQILLDWRLQVWNQLRQAAEDNYNKNIQHYKDERAQLLAEINNYDALTLRRMEQEEIMKSVLRWIFGPDFYIVPASIAALFGNDNSDPELQDVLDPNRMNTSQWQSVMEHGEFIKYVHNAIEWENVLYFTYPYFWDDNKLWDFKKFLYHPDQTHKVFLRSGAARVVLTIRPGFEDSFSQLVENGAFNALPGSHPYVTIAQEIQNFAKTNYPGFPPANPEQNARPLIYLEQRRTWKEMQFIIQLLDAFKADGANAGHFPATIAGNAVPIALLTPYLNGPITINGINYNGVNDFNNQANAKQLALDPNTPLEALLPTYTNVPPNDAWGNPYFYQSPGDTGDYDLTSFGADGAPGGVDKNADITANAEASLIATWYEYTPVSAMDIGITMNKASVTPAAIKTDLA